MATIKAPTVNAEPMTTNTAIRAMLLIADSLGGKPLKGWLSAAADITKPYSINQLSRYWDVVKRGDGRVEIA